MAAIDLCTTADVKTELEITSDTSRDSLIASVVTAVSRAIHSLCEREFVCEVSQANNVQRIFPLQYDSLLLDLSPYDLHATTSLGVTIHPDETEEYELPSSYFVAEPITKSWTYQSIRISGEASNLFSSTFTEQFGYTKVAVSARHWGFLAVPDDVKRAAVISVCANIDRRLDAYGLAANDLVDMDAGIRPTRQPAFSIPMAALVLLNPYRRNAGAF